MKTTILIKESRTQVVLHPESSHDKKALDIIQDVAENAHRVNLYDRQGGFTMFGPEYPGSHVGEDLMIVFDKTPEELGE